MRGAWSRSSIDGGGGAEGDQENPPIALQNGTDDACTTSGKGGGNELYFCSLQPSSSSSSILSSMSNRDKNEISPTQAHECDFPLMKSGTLPKLSRREGQQGGPRIVTARYHRSLPDVGKSSDFSK
jgi:hypothetical protein